MLLAFTNNNAFAKHQFLEKQYQDKWCKGVTEYVIDNVRVDCLTKDYAIEFDFAPKYTEAIGQSLLYAILTNKKPAIVLILEKENDKKFLERLLIVANKYNIKVWTMKPKDLK